MILGVKKNLQVNWCLAGDFNTVRYDSERKGCRNEGNGSAQFNDFISIAEFFDLPMCGKIFSWYGPKNKRSRIDHFLLTGGWINNFRDLCQRGLRTSVSDHIPISLSSEFIE